MDIYDIDFDIWDHILKYLDKETLWRLTRALPMLLAHPPIERKIKEYKMVNMYPCKFCDTWAQTALMIRVHTRMCHLKNGLEVYLDFCRLTPSTKANTNILRRREGKTQRQLHGETSSRS